ncbi:MAG: ATP-binding protein [Thermoplasmata archaeon]|nr:ATP-binding protein [Thermoplasmata archaeon]
MIKIQKDPIPPDKLKEITGSIFRMLSKGTYTTFTKALREAVSNSFDANAKIVKIIFEPKNMLDIRDPNKIRIQINDDGFGISGDEFWEKFVSIASSTKNPKKKDPITKRYPIGQFGIGALALIPFVKEFIVYSKKHNNDPIECIFQAEKIYSYQPSMEKKYTDHIKEHVQANNISNDVWKEINGSEDAGTVILIKGVKEDVYQYLINGSPEFWYGNIGIFKEEKHLTNGLKEIAWDLSTILPLEYEADEAGVYETHTDLLKSNNPSIKVIFSDVELKRKIFSQEKCKVSKFDYKDSSTGVEARGVIIANPSTTKPDKANGIMLRLNNVGIGTYKFHGLRYGQRAAESRITAEIHILNGLTEELANNREEFNYYSTSFVKLHEKLDKKFKEACKNAMKKSEDKARKKKEVRQDKIKQNVIKILSKENKPIKPEESPKKHTSIPVSGPLISTKPSYDPPAEPYTPTPKEELKNITDPIIDFKTSTGEYTKDDNHIIFKLFKAKNEPETITTVLIALKLLKIPQIIYMQIIEKLIELNEEEGD